MTVRNASEADIPAIVELLRLSLGEERIPKSEKLWRWKHLENPFGPSIVLLAFDRETLIGVRAFMRWDWEINGERILAARPVDTATHPQFLRLGIFQRLTLDAVNECKELGIDFLYNTPNKHSFPGYLKMGWRTFARMGIHLQPHVPWGTRRGLVSEPMKGIPTGTFKTPILGTARNLRTAYSTSYLEWRYARNPTAPYYMATVREMGAMSPAMVLFRLKRQGKLLEMRICDVLPSLKSAAMLPTFGGLASSLKAGIITWSGPVRVSALSVRTPLGPRIVVNRLNPSIDFLTLAQWKPTIGDMEVF